MVKQFAGLAKTIYPDSIGAFRRGVHFWTFSRRHIGFGHARVIVLFIVLLLLAVGVWGQQGPAATSSSPSPARYFQPLGVPLTLRAPLVALGDRLRTPGKERLILTGTYTDASGNQAIRITWELPGKIRIDLNGNTQHSIIWDGTTTAVIGGSLTSADNDLIESLGDDRLETLLYDLKQSDSAWRYVGGWFRSDNGKTKNYTGPFSDIHQTSTPARVRSDQARRHKFFCFDSRTFLLSKTMYNVQQNGVTANVETVYTGWSSSSGQAIPGQIQRVENGNGVMTVQISAAQVSPAANDGTFAVP